MDTNGRTTVSGGNSSSSSSSSGGSGSGSGRGSGRMMALYDCTSSLLPCIGPGLSPGPGTCIGPGPCADTTGDLCADRGLGNSSFSLIHSFTHSLTHSFTHSLIHSITHSPTLIPTPSYTHINFPPQHTHTPLLILISPPLYYSPPPSPPPHTLYPGNMVVTEVLCTFLLEAITRLSGMDFPEKISESQM